VIQPESAASVGGDVSPEVSGPTDAPQTNHSFADEPLLIRRLGKLADRGQSLEQARSEEGQRSIEGSQSFLVALNDRLRPLRDAIEIQSEAVQLLGERLGADWAYYVEYDNDLAYGTVHSNYQKFDGPSLIGRYPLNERKDFIAAMAAGLTIAEGDIQSSAFDTPQTRAQHVALGVRGYAGAPVVKGEQLIAAVGVAFRAPHGWTPIELALVEETAQRTWEAVERARAELAIASELADTKLLQVLSTQLIEEEDSTGLYEKILDAAVSIMRADFGSLQTFHAERGPQGALRLITSRGFTAEAAQAWEWIGPNAHTTCAKALRTGARVIEPDIARAEFMIGTADQARMLGVGIRAGQTTRLVSRGGQTVGMISTYWRQLHEPSERDLRLLDLLARQAADLMERTQAVEALRRNERQLKEADRRKDEFLAVLAHELRNPLAPIRTGLELIRLSGNNAAAIEETRIMMERQVGHMVRLIDDLLDVSRITTGKIELQRQPTPLATLVNGVIEANRDALVASQVSLDLDLTDASTLIDVDPTRFAQILSNVLHNAVKFTGAGGRIRVSAQVQESAEHEMEARIVVADTGVGISADLLPRVFDLFVQDNASARGVQAGLGIGLALARQLIEMHDGTIEAESGGPGLGSTFVIRVPLSARVTAMESPTALHVAPRITRHVVVIDDNADAADALRRLIAVLGGECRVAYSGESGLAEILAFDPDIVFLDIGMPGLDGYEVCRRIRQSVGPDVVIVALTGWGQEQDKREATRAGFNMHLTKPADPLVLERMLAADRPLTLPNIP
jgi:signal transduction histidine kinase